MSNVIFNESEQVKLQELTLASQQFNGYKQLLLRGIFQGQDAAIVAQAVQFFDSMERQTTAQVEGLKQEAAQRANAKPVELVEVPASKAVSAPRKTKTAQAK